MTSEVTSELSKVQLAEGKLAEKPFSLKTHAFQVSRNQKEPLSGLLILFEDRLQVKFQKLVCGFYTFEMSFR